MLKVKFLKIIAIALGAVLVCAAVPAEAGHKKSKKSRREHHHSHHSKHHHHHHHHHHDSSSGSDRNASETRESRDWLMNQVI